MEREEFDCVISTIDKSDVEANKENFNLTTMISNILSKDLNIELKTTEKGNVYYTLPVSDILNNDNVDLDDVLQLAKNGWIVDKDNFVFNL